MSTHPVLGENSFEWLGTTYRVILDSKATGGSLSIVDSVSPVNSGPPRHVHHNEDETFYILSGECEIWLEGKTFVAGVGESAFIPRGKEHTFRVIGSQPGRHLVILNPGGFENFFAEMAAGQFRIPDDMPKIEESAIRHHLSFTGPPLGVQ